MAQTAEPVAVADRWRNLPMPAAFSSMRPRLLVLAAIVAAVAIAVLVSLYSRTPDYRVLYSNVTDRDGGAILAALQQMNVPHRFGDGGSAILVPADRVHDTRLKLAAQGLPKGGLVGFELMENQKFGTSQFAEQVNYQRGLEGELARSIQSMSEVQAARVHLALSRPSVFVREQPKPSASVVLTLYPGRVLDPSQVQAIGHMVASSVPNLPIKSVTVVDQAGRLLSAVFQEKAGLDGRQLEYSREVEQGYIDRIHAILKPIVGDNNVHAQVTADIDLADTEQMAESYRPNQHENQAAIRSQTISETRNAKPDSIGGVPGALSNQAPPSPQVQATAPAPTAPGAAAPAPGQPGSTAAAATALVNGQRSGESARKDATTNYEVDKTVRHTRQNMGAVRRLSVAVVVNYRKVPAGANGAIQQQALSEAEMAKLTTLVKDAVGFNAERGDSVNVVNSRFNEPEPEPVEILPVWKQPETIQYASLLAKYGALVLAVLAVIFGVIRPLMRRANRRAETEQPGQQINIREDTPMLPDETEPGVTPVTPIIDDERHAQSEATRAAFDAQLEMVRKVARENPRLVANIVREWVNSDER
ncbi:flagellar basal-body MS-ring/collar protein FliF [Imbroritus primus]|uniref:flagellar basal-body MS-ring/collar protein FliF n=1 Tax=Imbroritus primus TaxID=3058603 RepID=UPI003D160CB5